MDRLTSKHTNLAPFRIFSRLHRLLFLVCLIAINGCVTRATPDTWNLKIQDDSPLPIPNLSLVRQVVPEVGTKSYSGWNSGTDAVPVAVETKSWFGDSGDVADPSCIYAGLKEALPGIDIIPTTTFWDQIKVSHDAIELSKLFVGPQSDRLRAIQADVMIIVYHTEIDVETTNNFIGIFALFSNTVKKTAAIIAIDLDRKAIIHGSKISFQKTSGGGYSFFIPFGSITLDPPDICNTVGRQAGAAIAEAMPGRTICALVVVAGEDPYEAASN